MTDEIFVFGSNLAGRHGKGAALDAFRDWGAKRGVGIGRTGRAYAIPTKDEHMKVLPLEEIALHIQIFKNYADRNPNLMFLVTPVGTGLAGYRHNQISPLFAGCGMNVALPSEWYGLREHSAAL